MKTSNVTVEHSVCHTFSISVLKTTLNRHKIPHQYDCISQSWYKPKLKLHYKTEKHIQRKNNNKPKRLS